MVPFGILGITADQFYLNGVKTRNLFDLKISKAVFPFDRELLVSEALFLIRNQIFINETFGILKEALKYDPNSVEILNIYVQYEYNYGNKQIALITLSKIKKIAPNNNIIKQLEKDYLEKGF